MHFWMYVQSNNDISSQRIWQLSRSFLHWASIAGSIPNGSILRLLNDICKRNDTDFQSKLGASCIKLVNCLDFHFRCIHCRHLLYRSRIAWLCPPDMCQLIPSSREASLQLRNTRVSHKKINLTSWINWRRRVRSWRNLEWRQKWKGHQMTYRDIPC